MWTVINFDGNEQLEGTRRMASYNGSTKPKPVAVISLEPDALEGLVAKIAEAIASEPIGVGEDLEPIGGMEWERRQARAVLKALCERLPK